MDEFLHESVGLLVTQDAFTTLHANILFTSLKLSYIMIHKKIITRHNKTKRLLSMCSLYLFHYDVPAVN